MNGIVAVKSYGFEWHTTYGLTESEAAAAMARHGIDWAIVQNLVDPLPGTAVTQLTPAPTYDDRRFRDALRQRGIRSFEGTAAFFRPKAYASAARPAAYQRVWDPHEAVRVVRRPLPQQSHVPGRAGRGHGGGRVDVPARWRVRVVHPLSRVLGAPGCR